LTDAPLKHRRRSTRLAGYDYATRGAYFVTICTRRRQMFFDQPALRQVAEACWRAIPAHAARVALDEWVVMPKHIHDSIVILAQDEANDDGNKDHNIDDRGRDIQPHRDAAQLNAPTSNALNVPTTNTMNDPTVNGLAQPRDANNPFSVMSPRRNTLLVIVRTYKAAVTTACRAAGRIEFAWQRGFTSTSSAIRANSMRSAVIFATTLYNGRWIATTQPTRAGCRHR
jgi:putative transposase